MLREDPNSAEIIKPILRGKDIKRYNCEFAEQYVILAEFNSHKFLPRKYPAVYRHLKKYEVRLKNRGQCRYGGKDNKGQHHWLELDNNPNCAYLAEFEKEKIIWGNLSIEPRFTLTSKKFFISAPANILTGGPAKYLIALLNSQLYHYKMRHISYSREHGYMEYKKIFVEKLSIPLIVKENRHIVKQLEDLVDQILVSTGSNDYSQNIVEQEKIQEYEIEIDRLVYELYGLTKNEIKIVESML